MKTVLLALLFSVSLPAAKAGEVKTAAEIEKAMGLTVRAAAAGPTTRGLTRGVPPAPAELPRTDRVVRRSAPASSATLETVRTRGITVVATDAGAGKVSVPVYAKAEAVFQNILFGKDSTELLGDDSTAQVEEIAKVMRAHPDQRFVVEGHTCDLGTVPHNRLLSIQRAAAVETLLRRAGAAPEQIVALGFGAGEPVAQVPVGAPATDPAAEALRRQNRRVVVRLQAR